MGICRDMRLVLLYVLVAALCACVPAETSAPAAAPESAPGVGAAEGFPITVVDDLGREVTIAQEPERVVSLAPSLTEALFAVGAGEKVVGVTTYCDYPEEAQSIERVGGFAANTISVEKIVALKPGLVLSAGGFQLPVIEALERVNVPVVALDPQSIADVYASIERVGQLTGYPEQGRQIAQEMKSRIEAVAARMADIPEDERVRVYWQIWDEPLMTAGPAAFAGQLVELAGGINIFGELTEQYPQISAEEVVKRNPDVIAGPDTHGDKLTPEVFRQRPGWSGIRAVQEGRIYLFDGNIVSRTGPRLADALEAVAEALYPERMK